MSKIEIKVIFDTKAGVDADEIQRCVTDAGMEVDRCIPAIGALFGSCEESEIPKLQDIKGVLRVAPEGTVQLPPFSPKVPQ
ncbi:hypothetical protein [Pseudaestuariivita rosea]|uniref:hypothetical protein n=1 Tax=Pseudaestuariivita rosea TaxID=2763263 RepID=UPI001ABB4E16|nr:hypothetical protein [Pseudaestuariivita rosea]